MQGARLPVLPPLPRGLSAVRDAIAQGHRVVIGPDGVEGRLVEMGAYERRGAYSDPAFRVEEP